MSLRVPAYRIVPVIQDADRSCLPESMARTARRILSPEHAAATVGLDVLDRLLIALGIEHRMGDVIPACERCAKPFIPRRSGRPQVYCSNSCKSMDYTTWRKSIDPEFRQRCADAVRASRARKRAARQDTYAEARGELAWHRGEHEA